MVVFIKELKQLAGRTLYTLSRRKPLAVVSVDMYEVEISIRSIGKSRRSPHHLSDILRSRGLTDRQIAQIERKHLVAFLDLILEEVITFWRRVLSEQEYAILRTAYALRGEPPPGDESRTIMNGISQSEISDMCEQALDCLRADGYINYFERLVARAAREVLKKENL